MIRFRSVSGKKNKIIKKYAILNRVKFDIKGDNNYIEFKKGSVLSNVKFFIRGNNHHITIGEDCQFRNGGSIWIEDNRCTLKVGAKTTFQDVHIAITEDDSSVSIGEDCLFAYDIDIRTGDSHSILDAASGKRVNSAQDVLIEDRVWVAAHSVILKGASIASDSVVGTGSIVTKQFPQTGVILAGNPAKIIKTGVSWLRQRV